MDCFVNLIGLADSSAVEVWAATEIEECVCYQPDSVWLTSGNPNTWNALGFAGWRTLAELQKMSLDDRKNTLIVELANHRYST